MPLNMKLMDVPLSHPCPHCGQGLKMKGSWFKSMARYKCPYCRNLVVMTHCAKVVLFDTHGHLSFPQLNLNA
jgi:hypothetical protein